MRILFVGRGEKTLVPLNRGCTRETAKMAALLQKPMVGLTSQRTAKACALPKLAPRVSIRVGAFDC